MDYEKKYNEALERARNAYQNIKPENTALKTMLEEAFPELRESEEERIRKDIIGGLMWQRDNLKSEDPHDNNLILPGFCFTVGKHLAYLEKQKEQKDYHKLYDDIAKSEWFKKAYEGKSLGYDDEQKEQKPTEYLDKDMVYAIMNKLHDLAFSQLIPINSDEYEKIDEITCDVRRLLDYPIEQKHKQEWSEEDKKMMECCLVAINHYEKTCNIGDHLPTKFNIGGYLASVDKVKSWLKSLSSNLKKKNEDVAKLCSNEWSEEDEKIIWGLTAYVPNEELERLGVTRDDILKKLKSLRPQPIQLKEAYKDGFYTARQAMPLAFMNYLDENRPKGKMSLSNGECEDIDKAFKEGDWAKIMRYYEKYRPSWKPSEEQMDALHTAVYLEEMQFYGGLKDKLRVLYEQLKRLM